MRVKPFLTFFFLSNFAGAGGGGAPSIFFYRFFYRAFELVWPEESVGILTPAEEFFTTRRLAQPTEVDPTDPTPEPFTIDWPALAAVTADGQICPEFSWPEIAESIHAISELLNAKMPLCYAPPQ